MSTEHFHQGHRKRLRERFLQNGLEGFSDHEVLELLLNYCNAQKDTNPIAHRLVNRFGNLKGVLDAPRELLTEVEGIGDYSAFLLKLLPDLCRLYYSEGQKGVPKLDDPAGYVDFFTPYFIGRKKECLFVAYLDQGYRLQECVMMCEGSSSAVEIHGPTIVKNALRRESRGVILAHNHFNDCIPSLQDLVVTRTIYYELEKYKMELVDHVIICGSKGSSMRMTGHFKKFI